MRQGKAIMVFTVMTIIFVSDLVTWKSDSQIDVCKPIATALVHEQSLRHERRGTDRERPQSRRGLFKLCELVGGLLRCSSGRNSAFLSDNLQAASLGHV